MHLVSSTYRSPVWVALLTLAVVTAGLSGTIIGQAAAAGGTGYGWGENWAGQVGDGTTVDKDVPTAVSGGHTFKSITTGNKTTCGLTPAGAAYCWGANGSGQVGDGTTVDKDVPTLVSGGHTFASIVTRSETTCGLTPAGVAYCWGENWAGQVGDGTTVNKDVPTAVSGGHTFASITTRTSTTVGVTATAPGAPTLDALTPGNGQASASFTAPASDGGSAITDYAYRLNGGAWNSFAATGSPQTIPGLTNGMTYSVEIRAINAIGPSPASNTMNVTPTAGTTELAVKARAKAKKLKPGKRTKVVRKASTNGQIKKVKTNCYMFGNKLTGKDKRAVCKFKKKKAASNAKVWVKPKCSVGVKIRVKIVAKKPGASRAKWQRTWKVKNAPRTYCPISGNG